MVPWGTYGLNYGPLQRLRARGSDHTHFISSSYMKPGIYIYQALWYLLWIQRGIRQSYFLGYVFWGHAFISTVISS